MGCALSSKRESDNGRNSSCLCLKPSTSFLFKCLPMVCSERDPDPFKKQFLV